MLSYRPVESQVLYPERQPKHESRSSWSARFLLAHASKHPPMSKLHTLLSSSSLDSAEPTYRWHWHLLAISKINQPLLPRGSFFRHFLCPLVEWSSSRAWWDYDENGRSGGMPFQLCLITILRSISWQRTLADDQVISLLPMCAAAKSRCVGSFKKRIPGMIFCGQTDSGVWHALEELVNKSRSWNSFLALIPRGWVPVHHLLVLIQKVILYQRLSSLRAPSTLWSS